ncbi:unnamed protein product [Protopolystoma xenopodis]|uniref:Uncharacterized protein n=1 Tax=Protopolystoma xenopodis TaxID=117903 RepID=A0A3S5AFW2_9PLAT|nr:unnamed protein product [Protopolystoma xenopodis]
MGASHLLVRQFPLLCCTFHSKNPGVPSSRIDKSQLTGSLSRHGLAEAEVAGRPDEEPPPAGLWMGPIT